MDVEVLKSYLVDLGFEVNQPQLRKFDLALKDAAHSVESRTSGVLKDVLKWQIGVTGAFTGISLAVLGMAEHVSMADQQYRLFGLRMYMSTEAARKLQIGLKTLGASMEEIAWDPELRKRFIELGALQDRLTASLGPNFERNMRSIRDLRAEVGKLEVVFEYFSMAVVSKLYDKLAPVLDGLKGKFEAWMNWVVDHMPEIADAIATKLVPVLEETWSIVKETGTALGQLAVLFSNFIGLLTGDDSIEGTEFSFEKLAGAIGHVVGWISTMINVLIKAEQMLIHFADAAVLVAGGHLADAKKELEAGLGELTVGTGATAGGIGGAAIGGGSAALYGALAGIPGGPIGMLVGALGAGTVGSLIGGATGATVGAGAGALSEHEHEQQPAIPESRENERRDVPERRAELRDVPIQAAGSTLASQARTAALRAGADLGIDPKLIFEQWQHESANFSSRISKEMNNFGGIRKPGSLDYRNFDSVDDYEKYYVSLLRNKRYTSQGILKAKTEEEFAGSLKRGGYYEDSYDHYVQGMRAWKKQDSLASAVQPSASDGDVAQTITIGDVNIHVTQPNATPDQIQASARKGMQAALRDQARKNNAQLGYVG